jgi:hypothetical protein
MDYYLAAISNFYLFGVTAVIIVLWLFAFILFGMLHQGAKKMKSEGYGRWLLVFPFMFVTLVTFIISDNNLATSRDVINDEYLFATLGHINLLPLVLVAISSALLVYLVLNRRRGWTK